VTVETSFQPIGWTLVAVAEMAERQRPRGGMSAAFIAEAKPARRSSE
jgi:hypothetical protein